MSTSREGTPDPTFLKKTEETMNKVKKNNNNKKKERKKNKKQFYKFGQNDTSADLTKQESKETEENEKILNPEDLIDMNTFEQLLDMDDEDDHEFSYSIVLNYFEQADTTFQDMDKAL